MFKQILLTASIFIGFVDVANAGQLSTTEINSIFSGQSFEMKRMGMKIKVSYFEGGKLTLSSLLFSGEGSWKAANDQLCVNITKGPRKGENCIFLEDLGNGKYKSSDGAILEAIK